MGSLYRLADARFGAGRDTKRVSGTLYIVATPIGNLEDMTLRALRILREVDEIACEDTRQTRKLLDRHGISKPLVSYHEHNEQARAEELLRALEAGKNIALVSDAGTPLIADPGYRVVAQARARGVTVSPIPGASALVSALSASGLPTDSFFFGGFLPSKKTQRRKTLEEMKSYPATLVFYEAPHRILEALEDIAEVLGPRRVTLGRELTKIHEEFLAGEAAELRDALGKRPALKGEITLMIGKAEARAVGATTDATPMEEAFDKLLEAGVPRMDAMKRVARERGLSKREVYQKLNAR
jgi:16S rRNA (cytidine1402-2'-O)-methyltransferase